MKDYIMISNYMDNEKYRISFNKLAINTFGLDFDEWYKKELFHNKYICYSYIDQDDIISNVSINKMNLVINGEKKSAIQIGTVMTHPSYKNQGLASSLINYVIQKYENDHDIIYLFANDTVLDFYPKFGFEKVIESAYELDTKQIQRKETLIKKLKKNNEEDYKIIERLVTNRKPISQKLGVVNDIWPLLVYCLYEYKEDLYYVEDEDAIVIIRRDDRKLHIYDVLSVRPINLDRIIEKIIILTDKKIEFHFVPELCKYNALTSSKERKDDTLFVKSKNTLFEEILFPMNSHA